MNVVVLLAVVVAAHLALLSYFLIDIVKPRAADRGVAQPWHPQPETCAVGAVTAFFDTFGVGSYAPTTAWFKLRRLVGDRSIPGTLTVGHAAATMIQTVVFTTTVSVDPTTLISMIVAATLGGLVGAGWVAHLPVSGIRLAMGLVLLLAAVLIFVGGRGPLEQMIGIAILPGGGDATGVTGVKLAIAIVVNFALGALMTIGIGLYAPCMILVALLGMDPVVAFPIMMGSCAVLMPFAGLRFIKAASYNRRAALGLILGGAPAVLVAALIVGSLDTDALKWLVMAVVLYTGVTMVRASWRSIAEEA